ncbi:NAD(P)H-dependent oxidoreductase [Planotetraspora phitsanulokensis]|uniref:Oxidoreductase n=1 Tax=Planotetraspora phitsanulokensis TaxID=575192 RepID=A0A8J3UF08_9ACTN|nr:CE1759 family FMN reductase [Planotetraspora phitsanulokensis]GII41144.1 oxidoreductase [Planotetraspora phitsanulokensis]
MKRTIAVVSGGLGSPSSSRLLADRLAAAAEREVRELGDEVEVRVAEVRDHAHDLVDSMVSGYPATELKGALETVAGADGLIAVTPTFTASYSGLFKAFFDVLDMVDDNALADKPVLIGATGGTARHSLVLENAVRPLFAYLRGVVVPTSVFAAPEDWGGTAAPDLLAHRIDRAAAQLAVEIHRRDAPVVRDPFEPTPFADLLGAG